MLLPDVNVFVNAFRRESPAHEEHRRWLEDQLNGVSSFGVSEVVLSGFVRIVTHPRIYRTPTTTGAALDFVAAVTDAPVCERIRPGDRHLGIFEGLCRSTEASANVVPDAFHAALAIEHGCTWITNDRGFARFPGLRWAVPDFD